VQNSSPESSGLTCTLCGRPGNLVKRVGRIFPADYYQCQACDHRWMIEQPPQRRSSALAGTWRDFTLAGVRRSRSSRARSSLRGSDDHDVA
jgi:hypothetical protein